MKYLGLDYGSKYIGVARSDEGGTIAFPGTSIPNDEKSFEKIVYEIQKEGVEAVVIGSSYDQDGVANDIMEAITTFKEELELLLGMPVYFEKEAFTSVHARQASGKEGRVDSHAAALILQRYMDRAQVTQNKASDTINI